MSTTRRDFLTVSVLGVAAGALGRPAFARAWQQQAAPPQTSFNDIRRNVGYFTGGGGTIGYLINNDGVVVVDTQFMNTAQICLAGLQERSKNRGVDVLFNTHHHGDHTGGNMAFKGIAKKHVANKRAAELQQQVYENAVKNAQAKGGNAPAEILVADRTFTDTWRRRYPQSEPLPGLEIDERTLARADAIATLSREMICSRKCERGDGISCKRPSRRTRTRSDCSNGSR